MKVIALHGLPDFDFASQQKIDPLTQLTPLRQAMEHELQSRGVNVSWHNHPWTAGELTAAPPIFELFHGTFCRNRVNGFDKFFVPFIDTTEPSIIIAYSAGALLFYSWLANHNHENALRSIDKIFCLAGPHTFTKAQPMALGNTSPKRYVVVNEKSVNTELIVQGIQRLRTPPLLRAMQLQRLIVLLAESDDTVPRTSSSFGQFIDGYDEPLNPLVEEVLIRDATHSSICWERQTANEILARV